ncbi:MAG: type II secretion system protein N [Acetobacteraceae bacterium]|nr:type II secretion system protein N [Acetobacteraceae bacterium]
MQAETRLVTLSLGDGRRWSAAAVAIATVGLAALALWLGYRLLLLAWTGIELGRLLPAPAPGALAPAPEGPPPAQSLAAWHLFGDALGGGVARRLPEAPETSLALELRGVLAEADPRQGLALIAERGAPARRYRVGDRLPGEAELVAVHADRVLLRRAGVEETLRLPRAAGGAAPGAGAAGAAPARAVASTGFAPVLLPGVELMPAIEAMRLEPETLAREVTVLPVFEGGRLAGVRLSGGRQAELVHRLGVLPTDVITAVDGVPLDSLERGQEILERLRGARQATVTVRRDGREQNLHLRLER